MTGTVSPMVSHVPVVGLTITQCSSAASTSLNGSTYPTVGAVAAAMVDLIVRAVSDLYGAP